MDWSYIAGFFDGEGGIYPLHKHLADKYWRVIIVQKNRLVLDKIKEFVGYGRVYFSKGNSACSYVVYRQREVLDFVTKVSPYIIVRRKQLDCFLKHPWHQQREANKNSI